jgi:hypothetical protein
MGKKSFIDRKFKSKFVLGFDNINLPVNNLEDLNNITVARDINSLTEIRTYKVKNEEDYNKLIEEFTKYYNTTGIKFENDTNE